MQIATELQLLLHNLFDLTIQMTFHNSSLKLTHCNVFQRYNTQHTDIQTKYLYD